MKLMFWNISGFGRPARRRQIKEYMQEENLDGCGLQETMKGDFSHQDLAEIGDSQFKWVWKHSKGHSGGILLGVKEEVLEMEDSEVGEFFVSMVLRQRLTNFRWEVIYVYGPANHESSTDFIAELSRKCMRANLSVVLGVILI
jgi:exonuclease III